MKFEEALTLLLGGKRLRRRGWRPRVSISYKDGDRFFTMTVHFEALEKDDIVRNWSPYAEDFIEDDWEVVPDFVPKIPTHFSRVSRYHREPVI